MTPDCSDSPKIGGPDSPEGISFEPDLELAQWFDMLDLEIVFLPEDLPEDEKPPV